MMFWVDIENSSGERYGDGPLVSVTNWESTPALSRAGTFAFTMLASDPRAALVQARRVARCYMPSDAGPLEIGAGIIEKVSLSADPQGNLLLKISGDDLLRELTRRQVGDLTIDDGSGGATTTGPTLVMAYAPSGWSLSGSSSVAILHQFEGESVLNALVRLAEITGESFRLGSGRQIVWLTSNDSSNQTLVYGLGVAQAENIGTITSLTIEQDAYEAITRVYPYGVGSGASRVTLSGATWTAPTGYQIDTGDNYIRITSETSDTRAERYENFKDISDADTLAQAAYVFLQKRMTIGEFYTAECLLDSVILPGQTVRVIARKSVDGYLALNVDDDLIVLEASTRVDASGLRTTGLQFATVDRLPENDALAVLSGSVTSRDYYTHAQPAATGAHASTHENGGFDEISVTGLSGLLADAQKIRVYQGGSLVATRKNINFDSGAAISDNPGADWVDITIGTGVTDEVDLLGSDGITVYTLEFDNGILISLSST